MASRKPETNQAFVKRIMSHDIMKQVFIIAAIDSYAREVANGAAIESELGENAFDYGFISGAAWRQCAQSVLDDLASR